MYRRLKNILGISFIIFAIVLAQIPMDSVQANSENENEETVSENEETVSENTESTDTNNGVVISIDDDTMSDDVNQTYNDILPYDVAPIDDTPATSATPSEVKITYHLMLDWLTLDKLSEGICNDSSVTLTLNGSASILVPKPMSVIDDKGEVVDLSNNVTFEKDNIKYQFKGWYKTPNGGEAWDFDTGYTNTDLELYANWTTDSGGFTVTYVAPGATSNEIQYIEVAAGSLIPNPNPTVTKAFKKPILKGYEIGAWYKKSGEKIENWNFVVTENMTITAEWKPLKYNITFNMNGGKYLDDAGNQSETYVATVDYGTPVEYPDETKITHDNGDVDKVKDVWYMDRQCLNEFDSSTIIESNIELFKRWYKITESDGVKIAEYGFHLSEDGTILYKYDGQLVDVVIPNSVTMIVTGAFSNMSSINSITLPDYISYISAGAFSSANDSEVELYAVSSQAKEEAELLSEAYDYFVYKESQGGSVANTVKIERKSSLYGSNTATGSTGLNSYVRVVSYPGSMAAGNYTMSFMPNEDSSSDLHKLIAGKLKVTDSDRTYYMHINLNTSSDAAYTDYRKNEYFILSLPLPESWQKRKELTKSGAVQVYSILYDSDKVELELLENTQVVLDAASGVYCVRFSTWHFSEYAIVYGGSMELIGSDTGTGTGSNSGNTSTGGNNSGNSGNSSGGAGTGSSASGNGNTSSGGSSTTSTPNTPVVPVTPVITTPVQTVPMIPENIGTQPVIAPTGTSIGSDIGNAHIKDSTPKTGDPLEYKALLVCMFFSLGILLLSVGNKKNSHKYLQKI